MNDFYNTTDHSSMHMPHTGDAALDSLLHEAQVVVQDVRDLTLPDDMIVNAVYAASDFWNIPHPAIIHYDTTCEMPGMDTTSYEDDVIGICRQQLIEMGVYGEDAIGLVATHETFHRMLQNQPNGSLDPWEHEFACDFAAGIRAGYQGMDTTHFKNSLINTPGNETHPVGTLRVEFIEYAKHIGEQMRENNVHPTFENCIEAFNHHLSEEQSAITHHRETVSHNEFATEHTNDGQVSFTGKYTETEIRRMKEDVSNLERELSYKKSSVHSHENRVSNANTKQGKENGSYAQEVLELNKAISERNNVASQLNAARAKLNNAT